MKRLTLLVLLLSVRTTFAVGFNMPIYSGSIETNQTLYILPDSWGTRFPIRRAYVEFNESDFFNPENPYAQLHLEYPTGYCLETGFIACPSDLQITPDYIPQFIEAPVGTRITVRIVSGATHQPLDRQITATAGGGTFENGVYFFEMDFADTRLRVGGVTSAKPLGRLEIGLELKRVAAIQLTELRRRLLRVNESSYPGIESQNPPPAVMIENSPSAIEILALFQQWRKDANEAGLDGDEVPIQSAVIFVQEQKSVSIDGGVMGAMFGKQTLTLERRFHPYIIVRIPVPNRSMSRVSNPSMGLGWFTLRLYEWKRELEYEGHPQQDLWSPLTLSSEPKPNWGGNAGSLFDILMERTRTLTEDHSLAKSVRAVLLPMVFPGGYNPESITQYLQSDFELLEAQRNQAATEFLANLVPMYDAVKKIADGDSITEIVLSATVDAAGLGVGTKTVVNVLGKKIYTDAVARTALKTAAAYKVGRTIVRARDSIQKNGLTAWVMLSVAADVVDIGLTGINAYEGLADIKRWRAMKQIADSSSEVRTGSIAEGLADGLQDQTVKLTNDGLVVPSGLGGPAVSDKPLPSPLALSVPSQIRQACAVPGKLFELGAKKLKNFDDYIYQSLRHLRAVDRGLTPLGKENITAKPLGAAEPVLFKNNYDNIATVSRELDWGGGTIQVSPDEIAFGDLVTVKDAAGKTYHGNFSHFTPAAGVRGIALTTPSGEEFLIPLIRSKVLAHKLELELKVGTEVKKVTVFIPALADGTPDKPMVDWVQQTLSLMPGELVSDGYKIFLYSGKQGTTGLWGTRFYEARHASRSMDESEWGVNAHDYIGKNIMEMFPNGLQPFRSIDEMNRVRTLYGENPFPVGSDYKALRAANTAYHEMGHELTAEIVRRIYGGNPTQLEIEQKFAELFRQKLKGRTLTDYARISNHANWNVDDYLNRHGVNPEADPEAWGAMIQEVFAEIVRLRISHEVQPLSKAKLDEITPYFEALDEMINVHCSDGFFDAVTKAFRNRAFSPKYLTVTAGQMLSKAAQAANEPDAEEAKFGVYLSQSSMGIIGFEGESTQGAVTPPPAAGPLVPPVPTGPVNDGPDCTNLNLVAYDDCPSTQSLVCRDFDPVRKLTSGQGYVVYQVHVKGMAEAYHWDFACIGGRGALTYGFLGKDNNWYPTSASSPILRYLAKGPNGVPAWGSIMLRADTFTAYSFWFDLR